MKQDALIKITGVQFGGGEKDVTELTTMGSFHKKNGSYYICYDESDATGFSGSHTVLRYEERDRRITLTRTGSVNSQLIMELGKRCQCSYDTGIGLLTVGVSCSSVKSTLGTDGGKIDFDYSLDINPALTSENRVSVSVTAPPRS